MRAVWSGALSFGLIHIPCKLYNAVADTHKVSFHQLHSVCSSRIQAPRWCPVCQRRVETAELQKGYEIGEGKHVILTEDDLASLPLSSLKTIEVAEFIDATQIDPRCFDASYFLLPEEVGVKAFSLLFLAMGKAGVTAIGKLGYREREHLVSIRPLGEIMLVQTLRYADELRDYQGLKVREAEISEEEQNLATTLIDMLRNKKFDLSRYHNEYGEALNKLIEARIIGGVIKPSPQPDTLSLADALLSTLEIMRRG